MVSLALAVLNMKQIKVRERNKPVKRKNLRECEHTGHRHTLLELFDIAVGQQHGVHPKTDLRVLEEIGFNNFLESCFQKVCKTPKFLRLLK